MYGKYKVIAVTPAGRKRYLSLLQHYVRKSFGLVDEWQLWLNTGTPEDIAYIHELAGLDKRIKIPTSGDSHQFNSGRICSFYHYACELETIYVRFDDDIVWLEECAIERMVAFRAANRDYWIVGGNIINNPVCTFRHVNVGAMVAGRPLEDCYGDDYGLNDLGYKLHLQFLAQPDKTKFYYPDERLKGSKRFGIQFISWFGNDLGAVLGKLEGGKLPHRDEELWMTVEAPNGLGRVNGLCGNALAVHFAYTEQRRIMKESPQLDGTDLLSRYAALAK